MVGKDVTLFNVLIKKKVRQYLGAIMSFMSFMNVFIQILHSLDRVADLDIDMSIVLSSQPSIVGNDPRVVDLLIMAGYVTGSTALPDVAKKRLVAQKLHYSIIRHDLRNGDLSLATAD